MLLTAVSLFLATATHAQFSDCTKQPDVAAAVVFADSGYFDEAKAKLESAIEADATGQYLRCHTALLEGLAASAFDAAMDRVRDLAAVGNVAAAEELLLETVNQPPSAGYRAAIPDDLQYLSGGGIAWWRHLKAGFSTFGIPLLEIIAVGLVFWVLYLRLTASTRHKPRVAVEAFEVRNLDDKFKGAHFSKAVVNGLSGIRAAAANRFDLLDDSTAVSAIPDDVTAAIPGPSDAWYSPVAWVKALTTFLADVIKPVGITLEGELHDTPGKGLGATVRLIEEGAVIGAQVIWFDDFDAKRDPSNAAPPDQIMLLARYVAAWMAFRIMSHTGSVQPVGGTAVWQALCFDMSAREATGQERKLASRILFQRAVNKDPAFRVARINVGNRLAAVDIDLAIAYLERAYTEARANNNYVLDLTYYHAAYNLAATSAHAAVRKSTDGRPMTQRSRHGHALRAIELIDEVSNSVLQANRKLQERAIPLQGDRRVKAAMTALNNAGAPIRATMIGVSDFNHGLELLAQCKQETSDAPLDVYNMAASYTILARIADISGNDEAREHCLNKALSLLKTTFQLSGVYRKDFEEEPLFEIVRKQRKDELDAFLRRFEFVDDAPAPTPAVERELAAFTAIGDTHAEKLAELEIETVAQLLFKAERGDQRAVLTESLAVDPAVVLDWARSADLSRILGLEIADVNLLRLAGVQSLTDLAAQGWVPLTKRLAIYARSVSAEAPKASQVRSWIQQASRTTRPMIREA
ncbi:MAG: DUF4332 domain-containing protein [Pseudomonadota bacterium]